MKLEGQRTIPAPIDRTWAALNDPEVLKASIAGCETLDPIGPDEYEAVMKVRIGPVNARFKGKLKLSDIVPPNSYRLAFEGQGGAAGFGKGTADVALESEGDATRLRYVAQAQVGGKIAQIGSRLVDAAAAKIADDFFAAFEARLAADPGGAPARDAAGAASVAEPIEPVDSVGIAEPVLPIDAPAVAPAITPGAAASAVPSPAASAPSSASPSASTSATAPSPASTASPAAPHPASSPSAARVDRPTPGRVPKPIAWSIAVLALIVLVYWIAR